MSQTSYKINKFQVAKNATANTQHWHLVEKNVKF